MLPVKSTLLPTVSKFFDDDWNYLFDWTNSNLTPNMTTMPSVNVRETADAYLVEMAAPGMKKDDFQIELHKNVLTIKCEMEDKAENAENDNFTRREFSYRSFRRAFNFSDRIVNDAKVEAKYEDGILKILLPKKEEAKEKPARLIKIK